MFLINKAKLFSLTWSWQKIFLHSSRLLFYWHHLILLQIFSQVSGLLILLLSFHSAFHTMTVVHIIFTKDLERYKLTMSHWLVSGVLYCTLLVFRCNTNIIGRFTVLLSVDFRQAIPVISTCTPTDALKFHFKKTFITKR